MVLETNLLQLARLISPFQFLLGGYGYNIYGLAFNKYLS